jgi:chitinase
MRSRVLASGLLAAAVVFASSLGSVQGGAYVPGPQGAPCLSLPAAPGGLGLIAKTDKTVTLSWTGVASAQCPTAYRLFQNGTLVGERGATSITLQGLQPKTTYTFAVGAINAFGSSAPSRPVVVTTDAAVAAVTTAYEAESASNTLAGGARLASCTGCSGAQKIGFVGNNSGTLQWNGVSAPSAGSATVVIDYVNGGATRTAQLSVNGGAATSLSFATTASWQTPGSLTTTVSLNAGNNTLKFSNPSGWAPDFDRLRVTPAGNTPPSVWPGRLFAPYIDVTLQTPALTSFANSTGSKFFSLGFIVSNNGGGCEARWGGDIRLGDNYMLADINNLRNAGGNVITSFGGAAGKELGLACGSVSSLQAQYQAVIDKYNLTYVDFDIEGGALNNTTANDRRNKAIKGLQATAASRGRELRVSFTLPVSPSGLESNSINMLKNAKSNGVRVDVVNIMAMDYGGPMNMGTAATTAATGTFNQIKPIFGRSDAATWKMIGITPMIGVNDTTEEKFTLANGDTVLSFSKQHNTALITFWDTWRDKQCPSGTPQPSDTCSGISQSKNAFTLKFKAFTQ